MRAGAKSYLLKDVRREELFQCIREVHAGRTFVPPAVAAKLAERLIAEELTPRELEVLRLVAEGKPNKLTLKTRESHRVILQCKKPVLPVRLFSI